MPHQTVAVDRPASPLLPVAGFLAVAGSFAVGLWFSFDHGTPQVAVAPKTEQAAPPEDLMKVYYPFPDQMYVTMPDGKMVMVNLSFYLEAPLEKLAVLQEEAKTRQSELKAELLQTAQQTAERTDSAAAFRDALPAALTGRVNGMLGSKDDPAPVREVLLTQFVMR